MFLTMLKGFVVIVVLILLYLLMVTVFSEEVLLGSLLIFLLLVLSYAFGLLVEDLWDQAAMSTVLILKKAEEMGE